MNNNENKQNFERMPEDERFQSAIFNDNFENRDEVYDQLKKREKKQQKTIFIIAGIVIAIIILANAISFIIFSDDMFSFKSYRWIEAQANAQTIKVAVDTYKAKNNGDISGLDSPKGTLSQGFVPGSRLLKKLQISPYTFMQSFDAEDFSLQFLTDGKDGEYILIVDAAGGSAGGISGRGPKKGVGTYDSLTGAWTGKMAGLSVPNINTVNNPLGNMQFVSPPQIPPPPVVNNGGWLQTRRNNYEQYPDEMKPDWEMWAEAKTAVGTIKAAVDTYRAKNNGDISSLDEPKGTLAQGFAMFSPLLKKLRLDNLTFEELEYFDPDNFTLELINDGKDGHYIIIVNATEGGGMSLSGPAGTGFYNSQTNEWTGDLE